MVTYGSQRESLNLIHTPITAASAKAPLKKAESIFSGTEKKKRGAPPDKTNAVRPQQRIQH